MTKLLDINMSKKIHEYLMSRTKKFPTLHNAIKTNGVLILQKKDKSDFFYHLARTVAGQQLSTKAASTIWNRVLDASESSKTTLFNFCDTKNAQAILNCGLSKNKVRAITELKKAIEDNEISVEFLGKSSQETIVSEITKLWGFGEWSADMITLSFFGQVDVWSNGDAALNRGMRVLTKGNPKKEKEIIDAVTPYKSYFSMHIWKALDSNIL